MPTHTRNNNIPFVCRRCLSLQSRRTRPSHRAYSSTSASASTASPPANPPPQSGIAHLTHRRLISLHGPDAPKFLQGLTTNNVTPLAQQGWFAAFLNAQGRVLWDVFVYPQPRVRGEGEGAREGWGCMIEVDAGEVKGLTGHLKRHKLRSRVVIREVEEGSVGVFSAWRGGSSGAALRGEMGAGAAAGNEHGGRDAALPFIMPDPRVPGFGHRLLIPSSSSSNSPHENIPAFADLRPASLADYTLRRYLHGIPEGPREIVPQSALPLESNIDYMSGVDFRKGCYVGQELTIRTHHTGVVRKRILPVQLYASGTSPPETLAYDSSAVGEVAGGRGAEAVPQGADIKRVEGKGRGAGKWLAGVGNVGLALCRLEMMTDVKVSAEGGGWDPRTEFKVVWGEEGEGKEEIRVKAFVPEWHRGRERIRGPRKVVEE